jgi:hypothetical protein
LASKPTWSNTSGCSITAVFLGIPKISSTLIKSKGAMANQMLNRGELRDQTKPGRTPSNQAGRGIEFAPVYSVQVKAGSCSFVLAHHLVHQQLVTAKAITTSLVSDEVLIADPRGALTPAQMVDQKLLALLGSCPRSLHHGNRRVSNFEWNDPARRWNA